MKITEGNINISYPDLGFAFNPIQVHIENLPEDDKAITVVADNITIEREAAPSSNSISFDLSAIAKSLFDRAQFHNIEYQDTTLYKLLDFTISNESGLSKQISIPVIWGALQIGERYTQNKTLTYFKGFPFTVSLLVEKEILLEAENERGDVFPLGFFQPGKLNIDISEVEAYRNIKIKSVGSSEYSIFDYTFDHTFGPERVTANNIIDLNLNIHVKDCPNEGVYLRWINKYGEYNYYLFRDSTESTTTKGSDIKYNNVFYTTDLTNNYHHGRGKSIGKTIEQSIKLYAHLIDIETIDFLQHLVESPIVDMFLGYDNVNLPMWVSVDIKDGQFAKSKTSLQDFECFLIPNEKFVQSL